MMRRVYKKADLPVEKIRKFLEPGPIVLVSSRWKNRTNIMTMGWHTVMKFSPSLIGCMITSANHSYEMIRKSKECVINIPTVDLINEVVGIGNSTGTHLDKFRKFGLTAEEAAIVKAPLIKECYANYECKVMDTQLLSGYNFFYLGSGKGTGSCLSQIPQNCSLQGRRSIYGIGKTYGLTGKV